MKNLRIILIATGLAVLLPISGYTQSVSEIKDLSPEDRRAYMESMSPDERAAMREKWRGELDAMSDEERAAVREKMAANRPEGAREMRHERNDQRREKWDSMSEEERAAARKKRQENKALRREKWESMSDEERAAARGKMRDRKHGGNKGHQNREVENSESDN